MKNLSPIQRLANLPEKKRAAFISSLTDDEAACLMSDWQNFLARPDQLEPAGDWSIWMCLAGRGWGKTRTGAEWVKHKVDTGQAHRIALIAETAADARDVIVEGESGILSCYQHGDAPEYFPSKRRIVWKNGAVATLYNATEPDQLRGPQHDLAWCDELAKWRYARATWDQLQFGMRLGANPRSLITTTPRPIELVRSIIDGKEGAAHITRGSTMDNAANLAKPFMQNIFSRYQGTRLGRQELEAEILLDVPGALWDAETIEKNRLSRVDKEQMRRIVVAVDPAVTDTESSDEHGIVVCGLGQDGRGYVLEDGSLKGSPETWARRVAGLFSKWEADLVVAEVNNGGDMIGSMIKNIDRTIPFKSVRASRGKVTRAEPVSMLYEQGKVHHAGVFPKLEDQMTSYDGTDRYIAGSPDRMDALVWGLTELMIKTKFAGVI